MAYPITYNVEGGSIDISEVSYEDIINDIWVTNIQHYRTSYLNGEGYNIVANPPNGYALDRIEFKTRVTWDRTYEPENYTTTITESSYTHRGIWQSGESRGLYQPATFDEVFENIVESHPSYDPTHESWYATCSIVSIDVYWRKENYEVKTGVSPEGKGTSSGDGFYDENKTATISTERKSRLWKFSHWEDSDGNTYEQQSFDYTVEKNITFTAFYERVKGDILCDENDVIVANLQGEILHGDP